MPVLIYGGRYDRVAVPVMMEKFKEYCPQAKFVMFEKSCPQSANRTTGKIVSFD